MKLHSYKQLVKNQTFSKTPEKVLFLHGLGGGARLWKPIFASLQNEFDCLALDQRGHGSSIQDDLSSYHPKDFGADIAETVKEENFHPCFVVGHSMGVRSSVALAHLKPEMVRGLVLIDLGLEGPAGGGLGENLGSFLRVLPDSFPTRTEARDFLLKKAPDLSMGQYLYAVSETDPETQKTTFPFSRMALLKILDSVVGFSLKPWIHECGKNQIPVLFLRGEKSSVWSRKEFEENQKEFSVYSQFEFQEIKDTGHGLPFEKRKEFVETLKNWIDRYPS